MVAGDPGRELTRVNRRPFSVTVHSRKIPCAHRIAVRKPQFKLHQAVVSDLRGQSAKWVKRCYKTTSTVGDAAVDTSNRDLALVRKPMRAAQSMRNPMFGLNRSPTLQEVNG